MGEKKRENTKSKKESSKARKTKADWDIKATQQ